MSGLEWITRDSEVDRIADNAQIADNPTGEYSIRIKLVDDCVAKNDNCEMSKRRVLADYQAMRQEFDHATDRAVAILGAAYVEEALLDALLVRLGIKDESAVAQLLENGAPLSTFPNKISLAEAVHLIGPRTRGDL